MRLWLAPVLACPVLACIALSACQLPSPDKDADALAKRFIGEVASGADLSKDPSIDPQLSGAAFQVQRDGLKAMFPKPAPDKVNSTGWSVNAKMGEGSRAELRYSYVYGASTVALTAVLRKPEGKTQWVATGLRGIKDAGPVTLGEAPDTDAGGGD